MINEIRNIDDKCLYCKKEIGEECTEECFSQVFVKTILSSPPFKPSSKISKVLGKMFADEIINYFMLTTKALEDLHFMGRMAVLSRDYEDLHNFAQSLDNAGAFKEKKDVLNFYKNPKQYENCSRMWSELDKPMSDKAEGWDIYKTFVEVEVGK